MATRRLISQIGKVPNSRIATNLSGHKIPTLNAAPLAAIGKVNIPRIVTLPLACFSTSATAKSDESERVHGKLRTSEVGSKAMRRKIAAEEAEKDRAKAPVLVEEPQPPEAPPPPNNYQLNQWQQQQQQYQQQQPVTFGGMMKTYFLLGIGISMAMALVRLLFGV